MSDAFLIDVPALHRHRLRAVRGALPGADFLLREAARDVALRLSTIKRVFSSAVDLHAMGPIVRDILRESGQCERVFSSAIPAFAGHNFSIHEPADVVSSDHLVPFANQSVDLAVSLLALQFLNDIPGMLIQIRRTLKPDGLFLGAFLGGQTLQELRQSFLLAEAEMTGGARARILPFADVRDGGGLLQRAGFSLPVADSDRLTVRYDSALDLMRDLRAMGAQNCLRDRQRSLMRQDVLARTLAIYARDHSDPDGRVRATFEIISISGWAPHESQQKPLRPGSAKVRLADVLGQMAGDPADGDQGRVKSTKPQ